MHLFLSFLYITTMQILISNTDKTPVIKAYIDSMLTVKFDLKSFPDINTNIIKAKLWRNTYDKPVFGRAKINISKIR